MNCDFWYWIIWLINWLDYFIWNKTFVWWQDWLYDSLKHCSYLFIVSFLDVIFMLFYWIWLCHSIYDCYCYLTFCYLFFTLCYSLFFLTLFHISFSVNTFDLAWRTWNVNNFPLRWSISDSDIQFNTDMRTITFAVCFSKK